MSALVDRTCEECEATFQAAPSAVKIGKGRWCSRSCYDRARSRGETQSRAPRTPLVERTCEECQKTFDAKQSVIDKGGARFCQPECYRADRARRLAAQRESRLAAEQEKREQRQREREAKREQKERDRLQATARRRRAATAQRGRTRLSQKPTQQVEREETAEELENQSEPVYAAVELAEFIESRRRETGVTIEALSARVDLISGTEAGSGARSLFRIRDGEAETVGLSLADRITLAAGLILAQTELTPLATGMKCAREMVWTRAELDEEFASEQELERRAVRLLRFSNGYLAAIQGIELSPQEAGEEQMTLAVVT